MNMNLTGVLILACGGILIYGAVKNKNPVDVVKEALGGKPVLVTATEKDRPTTPDGSKFIGPVAPIPTYPSN